MRWIFFSWLWLLGLVSVSNGAQVGHIGSENDLNAFYGSTVQAQLFRDIAYQLLQNSYNREQFEQIFYAYPEEFAYGFLLPSFQSARQFFSHYTPLYLYSHGKGLQHRYVSLPPLTRTITFIVIPGFTVEFSKQRVFEEVLRAHSLGQKEWFAVLKTCQHREECQDIVWDNRSQSYQPVSLGDVIHVGSLDSPDGKILLRLIYAHAPAGSLETFDSVHQQANIIFRRLQKYFALADFAQNDDIYFFGFSRGSLVALELMANHLMQHNVPWKNQVKGLISYAGVLNGSVWADDYKTNPDNLARVLVDFSKSLQTVSAAASWTERLRVVRENFQVWWRFLKRLDAAVEKFLSLEAIQREQLKISESKIRIVKDFIANGVKQHFDVVSFPGTQSYFRNIERLKALGDAFDRGISDMTSEQVMSWWKDHTLPSDKLYVALAATQVGSPGRVPLEIIKNPKVFSDESLEFILGRYLYHNLALKTGEYLNDGMLAFTEAVFFPRVLARLNGAYSRHNFVNLGLMLNNHFNIAFPYCFLADDTKASPFPREGVLLSLRYWLEFQKK